MFKALGSFIKDLFEEYKAARRLTLFWCLWLISVVVLRITEPEIILGITAAGATVVTAIIGILTTVIGFYQWHSKWHSSNKDKEE